MSDQNVAYTVAVWLIPLVVAIVFHEVAHGWVARAFGDRTAANLGRLTLNPVRHVDPVGTLLVPLMLAVAHAPIFGWAKPVPVRADRLGSPRVQMMIVALAGPATNFVLGTLGGLVLGVVVTANGGVPAAGAARFLVDNLLNFVLINAFLGVFNLLPLPPFDGGHVVEGLLPRPLAARFAKLARFGFPVLLLLIVVLPALLPRADVVARVVGPIADRVATTMLGLAGLAL